MLKAVSEGRLNLSQVANLTGWSSSHIRNLEAEMGVELPRTVGSNQRIASYEDLFNLVNYHNYDRSSSREMREGKIVPRTVIAVFNTKGGVTKTTTAGELAIHFQAMGNKVLLVDADKQCTLSVMFNYEPFTSARHLDFKLNILMKEQEMKLEKLQGNTPNFPVHSLEQLREIQQEQLIKYHLGHLMNLPPIYGPNLTDKNGNRAYADFGDVVRMPYGVNGPHFIPNNPSSELIELALGASASPGLQVQRLLQSGFHKPSKHIDLSQYNVIIFDCPPSMSLLTRNILLAADIVITPIGLKVFDTEGTEILSECLEKISEDFDHLPPTMAVPVFYQKRFRCDELLKYILEWNKNGITSKTFISTSEAVEKSKLRHSFIAPLSLMSPQETVAQEYKKLTLEIMELIHATQEQRPKRYGDFKLGQVEVTGAKK